MGMLVDGRWTTRGYDTEAHAGEFVRDAARFRNWVTADGAPGPSGEGGFPARPGRYQLYVSLACPWAHRTLIMRRLKRLDDIIGVCVTHPHMLDDGWEYPPVGDGTADTVNGFRYHWQVYTAAVPDYTGRVTVPVLWDRERRTIVSNESADILRMFNSAFDAFTDVGTDYYPEPLRAEIDALNATVYEHVNNGVYRCGFATRQDAYERAFQALFSTLDDLDARLARKRYLLGSRLTEADLRLFTTLVRFDAVYHGHFKCNLRRIEDYPALRGYLRDLYQTPGIAETVDFEHIKSHYYYSHAQINPTRIVPLGPQLDLDTAHGREHLA